MIVSNFKNCFTFFFAALSFFLLIPLGVGFFIVNPIEGVQGFKDLLNYWSILILGVGVSIELTFFFFVILGFFIGLALRWANPLLFYIGALLCLGPISITYVFVSCIEWGIFFLYLLIGFSVLIAIHIFDFFLREAKVPVEKWLLAKYWKFKIASSIVILAVVWKLRFSIILEIQVLLSVIAGSIAVAYFFFFYSSYRIVGSMKCHKKPPTISVFSIKECWVFIPALSAMCSFVFFDLPLILVFAGVLVPVGPLLLFILINQIDLFRRLYVQFISKIRKYYTFVYILIMSVFFFLPFIPGEVSIVIPPIFLFGTRFITLMVTYDLVTLNILRDLMCCGGGPAGQALQTAGKVATAAILLAKGVPPLKALVDDTVERHNQRAHTDYVMLKNDKMLQDGAISQAQWGANAQHALENHMGTSRESTTKIKNHSYSKEVTYKN